MNHDDIILYSLIKKNSETIGKKAGVGKNVTGETYNINGTTYTAGNGAEIFNDYTTNKAVGIYSHAESVGSAAIGKCSHAEGAGAKASGDYSHSEGDSTKALGNCSHSEGFHTEASENSHSEGSITKATGGNSHAEGAGTKASGSNSHAEGMNTVASQLATHAEGDGAQATGVNAHSEGYQTTASGANSHSEGATTTASGDNSHAEGWGTAAASVNQHAMGRYNIEDSTGKYAFIIGNGTSSTRSDAFKVDWNGLIYVGDSSTGVDLSTLADKTSVYTKSEIDTKIKEKISSSSCIVCSLTQPENLKKGLWIETNSSDKDINIVDSCDDLLEYNYGTCSKSNSTLTKAVYGTSAASVGSKCYVFGGDLHDSDSPIQIYDTETDILTLSGAVLDLPNSNTSATSVGSKCYIFGGWNKGNYYNYIQIYDTTTNVRTTSSATLNSSLVSTSAASVGSKCYIFGGGRYNGNTLSCYNYIQMYDTTTNVRTSSSATLAKSLYETSATSIGSKCYIFGGADSSGNFYDYIQIYDTTTNVRTTSSAVLDKAMGCTSATFIGSKCYIFGGDYQGTQYTTDTSIIQIYDTETNICTLSNAKLATTMRLTSATSIGSKCYIFGGFSGRNYDYIQIFSEFAAKMNNNHFSDSILITLKNDNDKQIANKTALSVQGKVYSYKPVENVYYVDSDDIVSELTYHDVV